VEVVNQEFKDEFSDEDPSLENQRKQICECKTSSMLYSLRYIQHYQREGVGGGGKGILDTDLQTKPSDWPYLEWTRYCIS